MVEVLCLYGSPRVGGNTETLVRHIARLFEDRGFDVTVINLCSLDIKFCRSCRRCIETGYCSLEDDLSRTVFPKLLSSKALVLASPVYFNNVSSCVKVFMDRTWSLRGRLKNVVGGAVVVGRGYGAELAIAAIHSFMLKHDMILCFRGVTGFAYERGEILGDKEAFKNANKLVDRMSEVLMKLDG